MKKLSRITLATLAATTVIPQTMIVQAEETEDAIAAAQKELDDYKPIVQAAEQDAYGAKQSYDTAIAKKAEEDQKTKVAEQKKNEAANKVAEAEALDEEARNYDPIKAQKAVDDATVEHTNATNALKTEEDAKKVAEQKTAQAEQTFNNTKKNDTDTKTVLDEKANLLKEAQKNEVSLKEAKDNAEKVHSDKKEELKTATEEKKAMEQSDAKTKLQDKLTDIKQKISATEAQKQTDSNDVTAKETTAKQSDKKLADETAKKNELDTAKKTAEEKYNSLKAEQVARESLKNKADNALTTAKQSAADKKNEITAQEAKVTELEQKVKDAQSGTLINTLETTMNDAKTALDNAEQTIKKGTLGWFEKNNSDKALKVINDHKNDPNMNLEDVTNRNSRANLDNAIDGVKNIIATNKLRQSDNNFTGLSDLKVDDYLMATAMVRSAKTETIWKENPKANPHSDLYSVAENLSFGAKGTDATLFWLYTSEKFAYDHKDLSDEAYKEAYKAAFNGRSPLDRQTGHYTNIVNGSYVAMGALQDVAGTRYGLVTIQNFLYETTQNAVDAQTYLDNLVAYKSEIETAKVNAQKAYDKAKAEYNEAVANKEKLVAKAKEELNAAKSELEKLKEQSKQLDKQVETKTAEATAAATAFVTATQAANDAKNKFDTATATAQAQDAKVATAKTAKDNADQALAQAKAKLAETTKKLSDLNSEKDTVTNKINNFDSELQKLRNKVTKLTQEEAELKDAADKAVVAHQTATQNLNTATQNKNAAQAAYDAAHATYLAAKTDYETEKQKLDESNEKVAQARQNVEAKLQALNDAKAKVKTYNLAQIAADLADARAKYTTAENEYNAALADLATATTAADGATATYNAKQSVLNQAYLKESELKAKLDAAKRAHQAYLDTKRAAQTGVVTATNSQRNENTQSTAKDSEKKETTKQDTKNNKESEKENKNSESNTSNSTDKTSETESEEKGSSNLGLPIGIGILATGAIAGIGFIIVKKKREEE